MIRHRATGARKMAAWSKFAVSFRGERRHQGYRIRSSRQVSHRLNPWYRKFDRRTSRSILMENERSPMFAVALIVGIIAALGFFLLAAAVAGGGM